MSSFNDQIECPNCGESISECTDERYGVSAQCHHCGYEKYTLESQMDIDSLNSLREDMTKALEKEFPPLSELPKWGLPTSSKIIIVHPENEKIILSIKDSATFVTTFIDGISIELHDYDVQQLIGTPEGSGLLKDDNGDSYLRMLPDEDGEFESI